MLNTSEVLGIVNVQRHEYWSGTSYFEALVLTRDRVIVVRNGVSGGILLYKQGSATLALGGARVLTKRLIGRSPEELLNTSKDNYAIPMSEIERVELKNIAWGTYINIITRGKKRRWTANGLAGQEKTRFSEYEEVFRPVFADKLTVSSRFARFAKVKYLALLSPAIIMFCGIMWFLLPGGWIAIVAILIMMLVGGVVGILLQHRFNKQLREA